MALTMPAKTWEKGGSGNASTVSSSTNSFTITKDNPLYEASLRLEKKKAEAAAKQLEEDKRKKYEEDKAKAKYYADNIQPFVKTLNDVANQTGSFFDEWRNQNESNYTQGLYTSLNGHYTKLLDSVTDNSYLKDVLSEDEYIRLEREVNALGKSIEDTMAGVKSASDVYAQYKDADSYNKHLRLSGMSSDELQKQIDALDKKSDYMSKLDSSYDTIKVMGDDVLKPTKEYDDFRNQYEQDRVELTSYMNNAKYKEESEKYGVDPKSMSYEEITSLLTDGTLSDDKREFVQRYYDSKGDTYWYEKRADEFVDSLNQSEKYLYKQASNLSDSLIYSEPQTGQGSLNGTVSELRKLTDKISKVTGEDAATVSENIRLAKYHFNKSERENTKEILDEFVGNKPILSNIASVGLNAAGSPLAFLDQVAQTVAKKITGVDTPVDVNAPGQATLNLSNDIREETRKDIEEKTTAKLPNGKNLGVFAYDALMNIADVATATTIGGLSAAGKGLSAKEMGKAIGRVSGMISSSTAAANKVQESIEAGDSNGIAIAKGAIVGAIEAITERIQIDNLVDAIVKGDKAITTVLRGALSEGTEEVVSDILAEDLMELAFGNGTRLKRFYDDYVNQGYSKKKAYSQAILDIVGQEAETFVSAAIAGAAFGGITAVTTRANDKATAKMTQDAVANEVSGIGEINFLRGINRIMDAAEESPNDAGVAQAAQKINDRITFLESVKKKLADNGSLKRVVGENGVQAEIAKVDAVEQELKGTLDIIRDGSYDATIQDYLITERENALKADAESTAMSEGRIRAAAQRYVASVGSIKKAVSDLVKTKNNIDTATETLQQEKKTLQESIRAGKADATAKQRIREINASIKKNTRDADRAQKLTDVLTGNQTEFLNNALGADQKRISKALSDASGRNVSVQYDSTMGDNEMAAMRSRGGASTLVLNPERIIRAQAELEEMGESGVNVARVKVVHEAGHLAARTDGTFVPKVYEVYASLRDSKVIPTYAVNEADIKAGYRDSAAAFLKTKSAQAEMRDLVTNKGMSEEEATRLLEDRYMQEEYVMHFLEYLENNGANLYNTIVPEKRNAFVEAMRKIAQFFRDVAAKIRGKDPASAKKMDTLADKLYNAVRDFAGGSTTAQESVNAKTTENTTATESGVPEGSTGTQESDERKSLDVRATLNKIFEEAEVVDGIAVSPEVAEVMKSDEYSKPDDYMEFYSVSTTDAWKKNYLAKNKGEDAQSVADAIVRFTEKMVQNDAIRGYVPMGDYKTNKMGPLRTNQEYIWTFDMDTSCPRTFQFLNFRDAIQKRAGRYLTYNESINLLELMRAYGQQIPCCYCYVENKRVLLSASYNNFFNFRNAVLNAKTDEEAEKAMYGYDAKKGLPEASRKALARWREDPSYNPSVSDIWTATNTARNSVLNYLDGEKANGNISVKTAESKLNNMVLEKFGITDKGAIVEVQGFVKDWAYDTLANIPHVYNTDNNTSISEVDERALALNHEALAYSKSASSAKSVENYIPYTDQLKNVSAEDKAYIIGMGGIRKHSSNDFRMDYVQDYFLFYADLAAGKWTGHTYSKSADFVKIFACTGDRINMSVAFYEDADGKLRENTDEGAYWRDVKKLREVYDNVGSMAMVTSDNQLSYALNADWIDMIIPFHASGLDKSVWYNLRMWNDYTTKQSERFYNADTMKQKLTEADVEIPKGANAAQIKSLFENEFNIKHIYGEKGEILKPHFFPGDTYVNGQLVPGHHNDVKTYFRLCEEYGVHPRFYGIEVKDANGKSIEITEHPSYLKLIKETSRTDTPQETIKFNFGNYDDYLKMTPFEYAMQRLEEEAKNGGFENTKADPYDVVKEFTEEYLGKNRPLGYLTERAKETRDILLEMSRESEEKQNSKVEDAVDDERKSLATSIYIKDGHTADGQTVDFINLILDGKKKGETRTHKSLTRKWVGIAKDGYVYGRVRFGEPYLIDKDSPEYADSYIEGTEYDIADGEQKYYYPILEVEDFRDAPKPITKHGNYAQYEYEDGGEDVRKSDVITIGMSDTERARILSGKNVIAPVYSGEADASIDNERNKLNGTSDLAKAALVRIGEEFGVFTSFNADDIDVQVTFSRGNLRESVFKGADIDQLAKLLPVLRDSVQKAVGVERHENRYYYDTFTTSVSELVGAYVDGEYIVPVRFGLKHLVDGNNTLHVVVGQPSFKIDGKKNKTGVMEVDDRQSGGHPTSRPVYKISIAQIFANVNTKDLLRYVPDDFLNENQRKIKWDGIADTIKYTNDKNDKKYAEFIRKGNLSAAMSMVAAAAKANGYTIEAWHGSRNSFNSFSKEKLGSSTGTKASERWFFAADKETAESYHPYSVMKKLEEKGYWKPGSADSMKQKGELYHLFLKMENPLEVDVAGYDYASHRENADAFVEYLDQAERDGNDGIILYHVRDNNLNTSAEESTDYLFKDPSQAKSADPITYDDNGNVIPLSERFNSENDDIRYSKETTDKRIARLKEDKEFLKQQMEKSRSVALSPDDVDKIVKDMRDQFGFDNSERDNVKKMLELIDKVVNKKIRPERMDEVWDSLARGARSILEGVYEVDASLMKENEAFIKHIRSTPLSVPEENENDFAGGYAEYRNENRKYVNLSRNGTPIDGVYEELCGQYPGVLDSTIGNPVDQIEEIVRVMKSFEPEDVPSYADTIDQASQEFVNVLGAKYMNTAQKTYAQQMRDKADEIRRDKFDRRVAAEVNRVQSAADRTEKAYKREIERIGKANDKRLQQTVTAYEARLNSIENAAARDAEEYERIINRYKNIEDAREFAGDRKEYARRIRQDARALRSAAVSPNSKKFVPEGYRKNVENIALWLDRVSVGGVNLNSDDAKWTAIAYIRDDINKVSAMFSEDFLGLANGLLNQIEDITGEAGRAYNKDLKAAIFYRDAYKLGRLMRKSIADMNKVYLVGRAVAANKVGTEIKDTLEKRKGKQEEFTSLADKQKGAGFKKLVNEVYNKNLSFTDGYSFFHRMGKIGDEIFETLQGAQSRQVLYMKSYTDTINEKLKDVDLSKYAGAKQKVIRVTLENGTEYSMTAAQAMSVVTLYERENGKSHIEKGGIQIYNPKTHQLSKATALTEKDIASIRNALDEEDNKVMKVFSDFMRDECTAWGNEATMEKYGFHRFTTANYFPINVNRDATGADMKTYAPDQFNVENVGFAKSAKDDGSAPVIIGSMIDVANAHVNGMATYAAYLNVEDSINRVLKVDGVKDTMRRTLGSDAEKYIVEMMNDLKGARKDSKLADNTVDFLNKMAGRYKAAAVSYNASTVAKQPLSYLRAASVIDGKYLAKGAVGDKSKAFEQMMKYSGIAVRKEIGYSDVGVGKTVGDQIGYTDKSTLGHAASVFNEFGMKGAAMADRITWEALWIACRAEQAEKNASAAIDEKALMEATAKRFGEVVARTQVVDSALTSAPVSRSNNPLARLTYAFTSEPIKGYNLFVSALDDLFNSPDKGAKSRAAKHLSKVVAYTMVGWAAEAAITSAFSAIRDDDDEIVDKFSETYFTNLRDNAIGAIPQITPLTDILFEVFKGYTPSNMADQTLTDVVSTMVDAYKTYIDPEGKRETKWKALRDAVESLSTMLGVPVKNIVRIANNTVKSAFHITNAYKASYELQKVWYNPNNATARDKNGFNSILADAYLSGDKEAFEYIYEDMRKMGLKPQQLVNSIAKDAFEGDIADSDKSTLVKYTPGSDAWYIGMKTIFVRDEKAPKATEDEITRVYKATGETSVLPKFKSGEYTVDGVSKEFTGDALDKYLDDYGRLYYEVANAMRDLAAYRKGSAEEQAWWLTKAEKYASAVAVYTQDKDYSVTSVGKWVSDYVSKKPYEVAKYIVGNLEKK